MPIETDIPIEIDEYQKKVIFGLTGRQLLCLVLAVALGIAVFFLGATVLGLPEDMAGWVLIGTVTPIFLIGFIRPGGEPFERYLSRKLRRAFWPNRLCYAAEPAAFGPDNLKQGGKRKHESNPAARAAENTIRFRAGGRERRKETKRRIKAAEKEYRQAAARARRAAGGTAGA